MRTIALIFIISVTWVGCKTQSTSTSKTIYKSEDKNVGYGSMDDNEITTSVGSVETKNEGMELSDYLRRIPGIIVMGKGDNTRVRVRSSVASTLPSSGPLFVIDDVPLSTSYSHVNRTIDINDIKNVDVLKDVASTTIYGTRGKDGVILINLKKEGEKSDNKNNKKNEDPVKKSSDY